MLVKGSHVIWNTSIKSIILPDMQIAMKQPMVARVREVGNPLGYLLFVGSSAHMDKALWYWSKLIEYIRLLQRQVNDSIAPNTLEPYQ